MHTDSFIYTSKGGRDENQDSVFGAQVGTRALFVVADGLGGHRFGNLASQTVVSSMRDSWSPEGPPSRDMLYGLIHQANTDVLRLQRDQLCTAKSTVVALLLDDQHAVWGNTGDSRLYYLHRGHLVSVTEDHSVAYKKFKAGLIAREEIAADEDQSCLLRSLGAESRWTPEISELEALETGDAFLLCSDGFWEYVTDEELERCRTQAETAEDWAASLLRLIAERVKPGHDNLSVITIIVK